MEEKETQLHAWQEIVGVCKSVTNIGNQITIKLQTHNKIIRLKLSDTQIDYQNTQEFVNKKIAILRTETTHLIRTANDNNRFKSLINSRKF